MAKGFPECRALFFSDLAALPYLQQINAPNLEFTCVTLPNRAIPVFLIELVDLDMHLHTTHRPVQLQHNCQ
jgi:hypothetical protein